MKSSEPTLKGESITEKLKRLEIPLESISKILKKYRAQLRPIFETNELLALKVFNNPSLSENTLKKIADWSSRIAMTLSGYSNETVGLAEEEDEIVFQEKFSRKTDQERYIQTLIPSDLAKEDFYRIATVLEKLIPFKRMIEKKTRTARAAGNFSKRMGRTITDQPFVSKLLLELVFEIDKRINPEHGNFNPRVPLESSRSRRETGQTKKFKDDSYELAGEILAKFLKLETPLSKASVRTRCHYILNNK